MNEATTTRCRWLVIGFGNELRGDDGAGLHVARRLDYAPPPGLRVIVARQLMPEHADDLARCDRVIFVDARVPDGEGLRIVPLSPRADAHGGLGHVASPGGLLELCRNLISTCPQASLLTLPAHDLGYHAGLTASAKEAVTAAEALIREMIAADPAPA